YRKHLGERQVERIVTQPQAANPLYLRALLQELQVFGIHERLDERIDHYLAARTVPELYEKVLERWEEDYQRERRNLVRDAMTALWAARRGLSEAELAEILGSDGQPLPRAHWSPLFLAACKERGVSAADLKEVAVRCSCQVVAGIPADLQRLFKGAPEIDPLDHLAMQGTLQKQVDNAISKTINLPSYAEIDIVSEIYREAWQQGLKGITIFRSGAKPGIIELGKPEVIKLV
ncbi:MAG: hypothetical protein NTV45_07620, partial [Firmicutes bacterium]|nr:hypothetical protein [Bacillota bacterium]